MTWHPIFFVYSANEKTQRSIREGLLQGRHQDAHQKLEDGTSQYFLSRRDGSGNYVLEISNGTSRPIGVESSYSVCVRSTDEKVLMEEFARASQIVDENTPVSIIEGILQYTGGQSVI